MAAKDENKSIDTIKNPLRLIKHGGKHGVKRVGRFFRNLALFALTNTALFFFRRLPFMDMAMEVASGIKDGDKSSAQQKLQNQVDARMNDYFKHNNTRWIMWLLPLNIVVQLVIIFWKIG